VGDGCTHAADPGMPSLQNASNHMLTSNYSSRAQVCRLDGNIRLPCTSAHVSDASWPGPWGALDGRKEPITHLPKFNRKKPSIGCTGNTQDVHAAHRTAELFDTCST
jgi:hypothetical protein